MRIFFEGAHYESNLMTDIEPWMYHNTQSGSSFNYLGYYLPKGKSEPVVILPKVFLDENGKFLEKDPSEFIKIEDTFKNIEEGKFILPNNKDAKSLKEMVMGISTWVYRSIAHYIERVENSAITEESNIQNVISQKEDGVSVTYLDTILQLFRFAKEHKNLFVFITKVNRQHYNKIIWNKTIRKSLPIFQNGTTIYMDLYAKKKEIGFDEELLKLFFSTLRYLNQTYSFEYDNTINYDTYPTSQIDQMLNGGRGTRLLRNIRYKYFSDEMVQLWNILFAFYDKAEKVKSHRNSEELLLVKDYDRVFEDMIDQLIGDDNPLKNQKDGKIIDHIYKEKDLHNSDNYIYYIADSKYYLDKNDLSSESVYKQYTYAKNVIQYNIDLFNSGKGNGKSGLRYRDELTEGYNITPNFFIRGTVENDKLNDTNDVNLQKIEKDKNGKTWDGFRKNTHFRNRLFDRDTLPTQEYKINFLFVLATYVSNSRNDSYRVAIRQQFKKEFTEVLNRKYNFYALAVKSGSDLKKEVEEWFKRLNGKIFRLSDEDDEIILALERGAECMAESLLLLWILKENSKFQGFEKFTLGGEIPKPQETNNVGTKEYQITPVYSIVAESQSIVWKPSTKRVLFGCYKDDNHKDWITKNFLYNVRYGTDRKGAVYEIEQADILVLYNQTDRTDYQVFSIEKWDIMDSKKMKDLGYPGLNGTEENKYLVYKIKETSDTTKFYPQDVYDFVDDEIKGAPVYLKL